MEGFTLLPFAFCAQMAVAQGQTLVELGYVVTGECIVHLQIGDSHGETAWINGHDVGVSIFDQGAEVFIDGLKFIVPKLSRA
jgi:hypothetical protein